MILKDFPFDGRHRQYRGVGFVIPPASIALIVETVPGFWIHLAVVLGLCFGRPGREGIQKIMEEGEE